MLEELFELEQRVVGENVALLDDLSLSNLRKYKYSSQDLSPTSKYFLNPYVWTPTAELLPSWLAPNMVTLIGISAIVLSMLMVAIYIPDFESQAPSWVYFLFAASLVFYQTMDNVDGKQARKTGTSSPLGELFDHGIDSLNCIWAGIITAAGLGLGSTGMGAITMLSTTIAMYFSTWETYYTHTLFLGYLNGPTEGLLLIALAHCLSGIYGVKIWDTKVEWLNGYSLKFVWTIITSLSVTVGHIPGCLFNVRQAIAKQDKVSFPRALGKTRVIVFLGIAVTLWLGSPGSVILKSNHMFQFGIACSFIFGRITTTIILSHLCWQPFPTLSFGMLFIYAGALLYGILPRFGLANDLVLDEILYLNIFTGYAVLYFFGYSKLVIDKLTNYLGINAFTIKQRLS